MITVGRMAEKYGLLPSEVEQRATTYDIMVSDVLATYDEYERMKASGKVDPKIYNYSPDELAKMMEQANGK